MASKEFQRLVAKLHDQPKLDSENVEDFRALIEKSAGLFELDADVSTEAVDIDGVPGEWFMPRDAPGSGAILYLHGGGYAIGSIDSHRHMIGDIAKAAGRRTLAIDYRLAPEHPYPAGLEDSLTAYRWLLAQGTPADEIVVAGDSAGGGMTMALLVSLRDAGEALPAGAALLSPWVDLTGSGDSMTTRAQEDPVIDAGKLNTRYAQWYAGDRAVDEPLISPLFADLKGLPPLLMQVGTAEVLLDDSTRLAERAQAAGVDTQIEIWDDMIHVWHYYAPWIPEGRDAIASIGAFVDSLS